MRKAISITLLLSFFLNIAHASVISFTQSCDHERVCEYVAEMEKGADCGDLCDMHHLFHFSAIVTAPAVIIPKLGRSAPIDYLVGRYLPPLNEPSYRPPIL
ncbi:hypothetical protein [Hydrogenimonas sp.]